MSHILLAVAGHVDHGKTALTRALTGVDTDRLAEEKRRGLTIESAFAPLPLPGGGMAELADVPGHERFIRNMLSGAAAVDGVLLVVAADDGPMPQTMEHLNLCALLGVTRGVVVLTKWDLVDASRQQAVRAAVEKLTEGSFLANSPVLPVSSPGGEGLEALTAAIAALADSVAPRDGSAPFRLHVDRVFTADGLGTVVTGAVADGSVAPGDAVTLLPGNVSARVRALQSHGAAAARLAAGQRAALNLAGVDRSAIRPSAVVAAPGSLTVSAVLSAHLTLLPGVPVPRSGTRLRLHHGTAEVLCRCTLRPSLPARLRLEHPLPFRPGDRFVLRSLSPAATIGGGVLLPLESPRSTVPPPDESAVALLTAYHRDFPLRDGMNREELAQRLGCPSNYLDTLSARGLLRLNGPTAALPGFRPRYTDALARLRDALEVCYRRAGLSPEENAAVDRRFGHEVPAHMVRQGVLLPLSPRYRIHRVWEYRAWETFCALSTQEGIVTLSRFRDALGVSRKYALLLLEHWDRRGRTRAAGPGRTPVLDGKTPH